MTHRITKKIIYAYTLILDFVALISLLILNLATNPNASPEWLYTIKWINIIAVPIIILLTIVLASLAFIRFVKSRSRNLLLIICILLSLILFVIPFCTKNFMYIEWYYQYFLSACWSGALLFTGISFFVAAINASSVFSVLFCLAGSLALALSASEIALLCSRQPLDGVSDLSAQSRYSLLDEGRPHYANWYQTQCGLRPSTPGSATFAYHRLALFDKDFFDVKYSFNDQGWRVLPPASATAQNELLVFGCSFTFGFGLEDEQTWAWQLAQLLGPEWRLENYSANGYGASQMLCLLEHKMITEPAAKNRFALFLGLDNHIRRNEFFPATPHYELTNTEEVEAGGKAKNLWIFDLANTFNGSQLAREMNPIISGIVLKRRHKDTDIYLAMIKKSATILHNEYDTQLIVLLWPDLEYLKNRIEEMGIQVLLVRSMLPEWDNGDDPGSAYRINKQHEFHPNRQAAVELATGLEAYFKSRVSGINTVNDQVVLE